jgi:polysaccharide export outer membrane protein
MKKLFYYERRVFFLLIVPVLFFTSCVDTRTVTYFTDLNENSSTASTPVPESYIQKNDLLHINISSLNPEASALLNTPIQPGVVAEGMNMTSGYLVNPDGTIQLPVLGNMKAEGLTKEKLRENIIKKILDGKLLVDPVVNIRFLNFRVTVLGEVNKPSVVTVPNERISLLEALGLAGDLTIYGKRENVLVIREENGVKTYKRLNLNSNDVLSSPYYYLKSNDIIYVEPNKARVASSQRSQQWIPVIISTLGLVVILIDVTNNNY